MSKTWFRFHVSALDKAKIQKLPGNLHKQWVNVLCIGTKADLPDGRLPSLEDVAHQLHLSETKASVILSDLHARKLLDYEDGWYRIHDWNEYQYTKDVSTERVKRFRERSKKQSETPTLPARDARDASESESVSVSESVPKEGGLEGGADFSAVIGRIADVYPNPSQFQVGIQRLTEWRQASDPSWMTAFERLAKAWSAHWRETSNGRNVAAHGAPKFAEFVENYDLIYAKGPPEIEKKLTALERLQRVSKGQA